MTPCTPEHLRKAAASAGVLPCPADANLYSCKARFAMLRKTRLAKQVGDRVYLGCGYIPLLGADLEVSSIDS